MTWTLRLNEDATPYRAPVVREWIETQRKDQINLKTTAPCPANTGFKCHSG